VHQARRRARRFGRDLDHRDVTLVCFSRAPIDRLTTYKRRMGWTFPYVSTYNTDFVFDFGLAMTEEQSQQIPEVTELHTSGQPGNGQNRRRLNPAQYACAQVASSVAWSPQTMQRPPGSSRSMGRQRMVAAVSSLTLRSQPGSPHQGAIAMP
jgi:hypothetical protein